jgi:hypothetical protein
MMRILSFAALLALLTAPAAAISGFPPGWGGGGRGMQDYEFGTAPTQGATGKQAAYVKAKPQAATGGFGTMTQCIRADNYLGKRLRFSGRLKTVAASAGQLWMRVDGAPAAEGGLPRMLAFYNMADRPVTGTAAWQRYDVVLDVPGQAKSICYGFFLAGGRGEVWADALKLEPVGRDVPVSVMQAPKAPVNLGFDQ